MSQENRKLSVYVLTIADDRLEAWLDLAFKKDQPLQTLILEALDKYIETESCQSKN